MLCLLFYVSSVVEDCSDAEYATDPKNCTDFKDGLTEGAKCCYIIKKNRNTVDPSRTCYPFEKVELENLADLIKMDKKSAMPAEDLTSEYYANVICSSSFISLRLLLFIVVLFLK